jgi:hypothetical protein
VDRVEPLEFLLPGTWRLSFTDTIDDDTGAGTYDFKLAGTFNAEVRDLYSGTAIWHGYWEIRDAQLVLTAQEVSSRCNSCLGGGTTYNWIVALEQVTDRAFTGVLERDDQHLTVLFERE